VPPPPLVVANTAAAFAISSRFHPLHQPLHWASGLHVHVWVNPL
jgi:hypothetical protein